MHACTSCSLRKIKHHDLNEMDELVSNGKIAIEYSPLLSSGTLDLSDIINQPVIQMINDALMFLST